MIGGRTGLRGRIWIFPTEALRTAFTGVDVTSELRSFDERSTDSSKRIRFSGEAEVPTLSFPSVSIFFFYCKSCLENFGTIIAKKFVLDFSHVGVKTYPLSQLSHARSTNIWRCFVYDELKRKDFFLNFKFTTTFYKVSVVVFQNSRETQHNRTCF